MTSASSIAGEPDSLPTPRRAIHIVTLVVVGMFFWIGATIASELPGELRSSTPTLAWMPGWGAALQTSTIAALLTYTPVVLVLFGISLAGQADFVDVEHRRKIRQSIGLIGIVIAGSAMLLAAFAVAASLDEPRRAPLLVIVIPTAGICWVLGLEVGRFVVPAHQVQLSSAYETLHSAQQRLAALPQPAKNIWIAHLTAIGHALILGVVTGIIVQSIYGTGFWIAALVGSVGTSGGLLMLLQINAGTLNSARRGMRLWTRIWTYLSYVAIVVFSNASLTSIAPKAALALLVLTAAELLVPLLFRRPSASAPNWTAQLTLSGAIARVAADDLKRGIRSTQRRIATLEALQQQTGPSRLARLMATLRPCH